MIKVVMDKFDFNKLPANDVVKFSTDVTLEEVKKTYVLRALQHYGNKEKACISLGITTKTLWNWFHLWGLDKQLIVKQEYDHEWRGASKT